jgi:hypothetical protein
MDIVTYIALILYHIFNPYFNIYWIDNVTSSIDLIHIFWVDIVPYIFNRYCNENIFDTVI